MSARFAPCGEPAPQCSPGLEPVATACDPPMTDATLPAAPRVPLSPFVFRFGRVGDMVMLTAVLHTLHCRYGTPYHVVAMDRWIDDLYAGHPDVAACWHVPRKVPFAFGLAWPALLRELRRSDPAPIYVCDHHRRQVPRIRRLLALGRIDPDRCLFIEDIPGTERLWLDCLLEFAAGTPAAVRASEYPQPVPRDLWRPQLQVAPCERQAARAGVVAAPCGLTRLFALCELAQSMISIDTGPAHAAAALGTPLVVLYGIQSARVWLPRSGTDSPVLALEADRVEKIHPEAVLAAWRTLPGERSRR